QRVGEETELLVLGADAPGLAWLLASRQVIGELLAPRDRGALDGAGYGHGGSLAGSAHHVGAAARAQKGVTENNCTRRYRWILRACPETAASRGSGAGRKQKGRHEAGPLRCSGCSRRRGNAIPAFAGMTAGVFLGSGRFTASSN